ncbi:MAG: translocation/assembly module TamB domain-containing protein, partial [Verrucomicrobiae bacterium]|nr:translocation/assembly module TamB domain-containing protein [Verrucomicrobiae bacterium]
LIAFHEPLLRQGLRGAIIWGAARQNLKMDVRVEGPVLGSFTLRDLHAVPTGQALVDKLDVKAMRVDYKIFDFLRGRYKTMIETVDLVGGELHLAPAIVDPKRPPQKFLLPQLVIPRRLAIEDLTVISDDPQKPWRAVKLDALLDPSKEGYLRADDVSLSPGRGLRHLSAKTTFADRRGVFTGVEIDPQITLDRVVADFSRWQDDFLTVSWKARAFGGRTDGEVVLNGKGDQLIVRTDALLEGIALGDARRFFKLPQPSAGTLSKLTLHFEGSLYESATWKGALEGDLREFRVALAAPASRSRPVDLVWKTSVADSRFELSSFQLNDGKKVLLSGTARLPLVQGKLSNSKDAVQAAFESKDLDLGTLFALINEKPPAHGVLTSNVALSGTPENLQGDGKLRLRQFSLDAAKVSPSSLDVDFTLRDRKFAAAGVLKQPEVQPLSLEASFELDLLKALEQRHVDLNVPVTARARLPRSSLGFLAGQLPNVSDLNGDVAVDAAASGTLGDPRLSGSVVLNVTHVQLKDRRVPEVSEMHAVLDFSGRELVFSKCAGQSAGGDFTVGGRVDFATLLKPVLDLRLKANDFLLLRNEQMVVRADASLNLTGPLGKALVQGDVGITKSRIFRNIEILPIGLPGKPAPQMAAEPLRVSVPMWPVRDWTLDLNVHTNDPFLLRSNLGYGEAVWQLKVTGTGEAPVIAGVANTKGLELILPFSRMKIRRGDVYFNETGVINPTLDFEGTTTVRDYQITAYIYGNLSEPKALFVSAPPMPQEDIVSLIATGATRTELTSGTTVLAGKATWLVLQQMWRNIFGGSQQPPAQEDDFLSRFEFGMGAPDPKTGREQMTASFKMSEQVHVIGEVGIEGGFGMRLKYLLHFR